MWYNVYGYDITILFEYGDAVRNTGKSDIIVLKRSMLCHMN